MTTQSEKCVISAVWRSWIVDCIVIPQNQFQKHLFFNPKSGCQILSAKTKWKKQQQPQSKQKSFVFSAVLLAVGCNWKRHASNTSLVQTMKLILKRIPHTQTHESIFYAHKHKHVSKHKCMLCSVFVYTRKRKWDGAMSETLILHHLVIFNMLIKVPCGNRVLNMLHQASAKSPSFNTARSVHAHSYMGIIIIVYVLYCVINFVLVLHTAIRPR